MDPALATKPHNVHPELLAENKRLQLVSTSDVDDRVSRFEDIECSTCHKEHHGNRDLTLLTDTQCQTCHQQQFDSFQQGHPEFTNWPQSRRQSIAFDHASHGFKHFPSSNAEFDCKMCHVDDSYSNVKTLASYEQSCAKCHEQDIHLRSQPGLQIVELPMLDIDAIRQHGFSVGLWPENAAGDFDGRIPELMQILMSCDRRFMEIMENRGGGFDFSDLNPESASDVKDAVEIAWSIKKMIHDLALGGRDALLARFSTALNLSQDDERIKLLTAGLDANVFAGAANRWLPGISAEIPMQAGAPEFKSASLETIENVALFVESESILPYVSNTRRQDDDTLIANPLPGLMNGQLQDQLLRFPASEKGPIDDSEQASKAAEPNSNVVINEASSGRKLVEETPVAMQSNNAHSGDRMVQGQANDHELLVPNPLSGLSNSSRPAFESQSEASQRQIANEFANEIEKAKNRQANSIEPRRSDHGTKFEQEERGEILVGNSRNSGWFRNDQLFQISYRPSGHADDLLVTMMDIVASQADGDDRATGAFMKKMVSDSSIGACNDCHTIDAESGGMRVNWVPHYRDPSLRSFTHFSHGPHLVQSELADCTVCHQLNAGLTNAHTFDHFDSGEVISNFEPIRKSNCVSCHHEAGAGSSCTQCHDYHIGAKILMGQ